MAENNSAEYTKGYRAGYEACGRKKGEALEPLAAKLTLIIEMLCQPSEARNIATARGLAPTSSNPLLGAPTIQHFVGGQSHG